MKIADVIRALRLGASVKNETGVKWAGAAVTVALIALALAQSFGWLGGIENGAVVELVMAAVVLYAQIATTTKIGVLPPERLSDGELRGGSVQAGDPEPGRTTDERGNDDGFPVGPFFDS